MMGTINAACVLRWRLLIVIFICDLSILGRPVNSNRSSSAMVPFQHGLSRGPAGNQGSDSTVLAIESMEADMQRTIVEGQTIMSTMGRMMGRKRVRLLETVDPDEASEDERSGLN